MIKRAIFVSAAGAALVAGAGSAQAAQIILSPSSIVGSTGDFSALFPVSGIVNQQVGDVIERFADGSTWLNPDGRDPAFITIDLGTTYQLGRFDLFNSYNIGDRATGTFEIRASNSLVATAQPFATGFTLGADSVTLAAGALTKQSRREVPITPDSFASSNFSDSYRYIQFRPLTPIAPAYGGKNFGLVELRVFDAEGLVGAVPEPGTWALLILGFGAVGSAMRRRTGAQVRQRSSMSFA